MALIKSVRGFTPQIGENCYLADNATIIGEPPVIPETDAIRRYLETILKKSEKPTKQDYAKQRKMLEPAKLLLHLQMTIPSACHKNIRHDQQ